MQPPIRARLKSINSYASPPFVSNDQKGLKTQSIYSFPSGVDDGAGSTLGSGGAEGPGAVSRRGEVMVGEVASSSSSTTLATTVAAEDEYSESSMEGVRRKTTFWGGVESNLKRLVKPPSRRSSSGHSSVRLFQDRRQAPCATKAYLVPRLRMRLTSTKRLCI